MSYDLSVHLKGLNDSIIPEWLSQIRRFNMDVEVYPGFSFNNHSGFLPFKVVIYDCPNRRIAWVTQKGSHFGDTCIIELLTGHDSSIKQRQSRTLFSVHGCRCFY